MTALVVIDAKECSYTRYEGRKRREKFAHASPLSSYWVEEIRLDPQQFAAGQNEAGPEAA